MFHGSEGSTTVRKRDDEEWACQAFLDFLRNSYPAVRFTCRPVPPEEEPPDFWLETQTRNIAVEVTAIWDQITLGGKQVSSAILWCWARTLLKEIEESAAKEVPFQGKYVVEVQASRLRWQAREQIKEAIIRFISSNPQTETADPSRNFDILPGGWTIERCSSDRRSLQLVVPGATKWEGELTTELARLVSEIVHRKDSKLSKRGCPYILLLLDQYHLADEDTWESIGRQLQLPKSCSMVARIWDDKRVQVLAGELPDTCQPLPISPVES